MKKADNRERQMMERISRKWKSISVLLIAAVVITCSSAYTQFAWAAGSVHYIAVASDRHSTEDAIEITMSGMPDAVEYVCLNGDMSGQKGGGNGGPPLGVKASSKQEAYDTSSVLKEVQGVFPKLTSDNVSIVYGSHDANANDDANIMKCADPDALAASGGSDNAAISQGMSGLIYTGYDVADPAYYVYGVSYYDMMDPGAADIAAQAFKTFADNNPGIPLIVIGHVPLHALRGDNLGASYWNTALNHAATGRDDGTQVMREVAYLHGHNHTVEKTEYFIKPGEKLTVQGTAKEDSAESTIYYTYITAGYLRDNHTATLVTVENGQLSFTKYKGCIVTFDTGGGEDISDQVVNKDSMVTEPADPVREGHVFTGWYKEPACENTWDFSTDTVTEDTTIYAGWVKGIRPAPAALSTSVNASKKQAVLSWKKTNGATDYRVAYRKAGAGQWTRRWSNGSALYKISKLTAKGLYDFKVTAAAESGDRMIYSADSAISHRYIGTAVKVKTKALKKSVKVSWKKDKKASAYQVQYSTSKSMKNAAVITVASSKNTCKIKGLKKGKRYYIRVRPVVKKKGITYIGAYSARKTTRV